MNLRRKRKSLGGIPTASMSDIAFLLLVFFLSTTKFDIKKGLGLVLPEMGESKGRIKKENLTRVEINDEGKILLRSVDLEEEVALSELEGKIYEIVRENPDMVVSLRTHSMSKYKFMVQALDKIQAAGAEKISLSTN